MKRWPGRLAVILSSLLCALGSWACQDFSWDSGGEGVDRGEPYQGPRGRAAIGADVRCFDNFDKFKYAMTKEGKTKTGYQWHHIVAQHDDNKKKFGERNLHCTDNLVHVTKEDHEKLNGYYSRHDPRWGNRSLREFLRNEDFATQYARGCTALKDENVAYTEPVCL